MYEPYSGPQSQTQLQSPRTYYSSEYADAGPSTSQLSPLHYSYPSPPQNYSVLPLAQPQHNYTRHDHPRSDAEIHEHPPAPTVTSAQPYTVAPNGIFSTTRVRIAPRRSASHEHQPQPQPQQVSGGWITSPMVPYRPRTGSPRSDYHSSSSSSSSYASSPTAPLYPLFSGSEPGSNSPDTRSLPRLQMPLDPTPVVLISSPTNSDRRGDIGPCRDLAPLNSLTRLHPYRRDPTDDKALRLLQLGPRPSPLM